MSISPFRQDNVASSAAYWLIDAEVSFIICLTEGVWKQDSWDIQLCEQAQQCVTKALFWTFQGVWIHRLLVRV